MSQCSRNDIYNTEHILYNLEVVKKDVCDYC